MKLFDALAGCTLVVAGFMVAYLQIMPLIGGIVSGLGFFRLIELWRERC